MPYVSKDHREHLDPAINSLIAAIDELAVDAGLSEGDVNYVVSRIVMAHFKLDTKPSYKKINAAVGVLECIKQELYRRVAAYEDDKIEQNGDVKEYEGFLSTMAKFT